MHWDIHVIKFPSSLELTDLFVCFCVYVVCLHCFLSFMPLIIIVLSMVYVCRYVVVYVVDRRSEFANK